MTATQQEQEVTAEQALERIVILEARRLRILNEEYNEENYNDADRVRYLAEIAAELESLWHHRRVAQAARHKDEW